MLATAVSIGMLRYAMLGPLPPITVFGIALLPAPGWAAAIGILLLGGVVGAAIGHTRDREVGATAGAIVGGTALLVIFNVVAFILCVVSFFSR